MVTFKPFALLLFCAVGTSLGQETPVNPPRSRTGLSEGPSAGSPVVSNVQVQAISHSSAKVSFTTGIPGGNTAARVDYGTTTALVFQTMPRKGGSAAQTARYEIVGGMRPATRYYFRPVVSDNGGKFDTSWTCPSAGNFSGYVCEGRGSLPYFTTAPAPAVVPMPPEMPKPVDDTSMPTIDGSTFSVSVDSDNHCTDFQEQLQAAAAADRSLNHQVVIPVGATCYGKYVLPQKRGPGVVVIRPSTADNLLPPPGVRIDPSYRSRMATLSTPPVPSSTGQWLNPTLTTAKCSSGTCTEGWRLVGIEITHPSHDQFSPKVSNIVDIRGNLVTVDRPHGMAGKNQVQVAGVQGMTGANGTWQIDQVHPTTFRIGTETSGTYSGGGYVVYALSTAITDCSNTSPVVCTTATPHGLSSYTPRAIQSIRGDTITLPAGHGLRLHAAVEIRGSSSPAHNGVWMINKATSNEVTLSGGPSGSCTGDCGTITPRWSVQIAEVQGNTAANGSHLFHVLSPTKIELPDASGNGNYTSGGFLSYNPDFFFVLALFDRNSERIVLDRCYIHGQGFPTRLLIGISFDSSNSAIIDSYFDEINYWAPVNPVSGGIEPGGRGGVCVNIDSGHRLKISNNACINSHGALYAGEFRPTPEMTPTDIEITRNLFFNSDRLRSGSPQSDGRRYQFSHLMEFKKGQRILIDGNIFDGSWADRTPTGPAILFSPRGVRGLTDNVISDVTLTNNVFRRVSHAIYVVGNEGRRDFSSDITSRVKISNNLFAEINYWKMHSEPALSTGRNLSEGTGSGGAALWILGPVEDLEFTHNTVLDQRGTNPKFVHYNYGRSAGVVIRYNIFPHNEDMNNGGLTQASAFGWAAPAIKGLPSDAFWQYFVHAPGPDPTSAFSDNVVIPGVRGTFFAENFDDSAPKVNFTKVDCEDFYKGFPNITCAGTGTRSETANQRFDSIFGGRDSFLPAVALPGNPGINAEGMERALGVSVRQALQASERIVTMSPPAALHAAEPAEQRSPVESARAQLDRTAAGGCVGTRCLAADAAQLERLLAQSACGDRIELPAGETLLVERPIRLAGVDCPADNPLVITTTAELQLPAASGRITPSHTALLARLEATGSAGGVFVSEEGVAARGIVLRGLELTAGEAARPGPLLRLEGAADIVVDQCYIHAGSTVPSGAAVLLIGERISVTNSFLDGYCVLPAAPETATVVAGGAGPLAFRNNHITAGAAALTVGDGTALEFRHNTVQRSAAHNPCRPEWDGLHHSLGELLRLEGSASRIFEFNLFEDSWAGNLHYPAAVSLEASSGAVFRSNTFRGVSHAFRLGTAGRPGRVPVAAPGRRPELVIEGNVLDGSPASAGDRTCGAWVEPALFEPETDALRLMPPGLAPVGLPAGCDAESTSQGSAQESRGSAKNSAFGLPKAGAPSACGSLPPAQILDLRVRADSEMAVFHYEVSESLRRTPCVVEAWRAGHNAAAGVAASDNLTGRERSAAIAIEAGNSYDYRLMCGGDMQRGTFRALDADPIAEIGFPSTAAQQ